MKILKVSLAVIAVVMSFSCNPDNNEVALKINNEFNSNKIEKSSPLMRQVIPGLRKRP